MIIDRIGFAFENCECLEIEGKYLFHLYCGDINYDISMSNCDCSFISQSKRFSSFSVGILAEAASAKLLDSCLFDDYRDSIARLRGCDDLVAVDLVFKENHSDQYSPLSGYYYVPWGGDDDYINKAIRYSENERGDMFISVNLNYMNEMKDNTENNLSHFNDNYFYDSNYLKRIAEERNLKI